MSPIAERGVSQSTPTDFSDNAQTSSRSAGLPTLRSRNRDAAVTAAGARVYSAGNTIALLRVVFGWNSPLAELGVRFAIPPSYGRFGDARGESDGVVGS
jgi:hypothetical protein